MNRFNATAFRFAAAAFFGAALSPAAIASSNTNATNRVRLSIAAHARLLRKVPMHCAGLSSACKSIESLEFSDYMTDAQLLAWRDAKEPTRTVRANADGETKR